MITGYHANQHVLHNTHRYLRSPPLAPMKRTKRCRCPLRPTAAAGSGDPDDQPLNADIDQLAKLLSQKASEMRMDYISDPVDPEGPNNATADLSEVSLYPRALGPFGYQSPEAEAKALAEIGSPGFISQDFAILQELGQLRVQSQQAQEDTSSSSSSSGSGRETAVVVFAARYITGMPYQDPLTVMLKEYLPGAKSVACNELLVLKQLCGIPEHKWQAAAKPITADPPVVPVLGYLSAPASDPGYEISGKDEDSLWLVYKWEGLRPLEMYQAAGGPPPVPGGLQGLLIGREAAQASAAAARRNMLRAIARGLLQALSYCHQKGVTHCSLSSGCVMLSSCSDADAEKLVVKLDNLGFARQYTAGNTPASSSPLSSQSPELLSQSDPDSDRSWYLKQDLQAAALILADTFLSGLASGRDQAVLDTLGLQRLMFDVFHEDIEQLRHYCQQDEAYDDFVAFLDEADGSGWAMLASLMTGKAACNNVLAAAQPFLEHQHAKRYL